MFIEECAKTPRLSTEPILALHSAGRLEEGAPGETSRIDTAASGPA